MDSNAREAVFHFFVQLPPDGIHKRRTRHGLNLWPPLIEPASRLVVCRGMALRAYRDEVSHAVRVVSVPVPGVVYTKDRMVFNGFSTYLAGIAVTVKHGFPKRGNLVSFTALVIGALGELCSCLYGLKLLCIE